jgi:hypothetical protein
VLASKGERAPRPRGGTYSSDTVRR